MDGKNLTAARLRAYLDAKNRLHKFQPLPRDASAGLVDSPA
jgi:hypothetical protein